MNLNENETNYASPINHPHPLKYFDRNPKYSSQQMRMSLPSHRPVNPSIFFDTNFELNPVINGVTLEPRLKEYLYKRKFNKENNILDDIPLKKKYFITNEDIKTIRKYRRKLKKDIQNEKYKFGLDLHNSKQIDENLKKGDIWYYDSKKFIDYNKLSEHSFQYVNPKIVNPSLGVELWNRGGESSRLNNRKSTRKTSNGEFFRMQQ
jgi:hypothetical protein